MLKRNPSDRINFEDFSTHEFLTCESKKDSTKYDNLQTSIFAVDKNLTERNFQTNSTTNYYEFDTNRETAVKKSFRKDLIENNQNLDNRPLNKSEEKQKLSKEQANSDKELNDYVVVGNNSGVKELISKLNPTECEKIVDQFIIIVEEISK
jgi:hypothetical protein